MFDVLREKWGKIDFVVLGIGINANVALKELRVEGASSLSQELGHEINQERLFDEILVQLRDYYEKFYNHRGSTLASI